MLRQRERQVNVENHGKQGLSPLDSDEQDKVVAALGEEAKHQNVIFNRVFSVLLVVCGFAIVLCSVQLWFFEDTHPLAHRTVVGNVPNIAFQASYLGYLLDLYLCHKIAQGNRWHIAPALCMAWTFMFSWLAVFRHFEVTNPLFYWLPLGPVVLFGLAVYIYSAAQKTERELDELGQMRYNHKEL